MTTGSSWQPIGKAVVTAVCFCLRALVLWEAVVTAIFRQAVVTAITVLGANGTRKEVVVTAASHICT